MPDSTSPGRSYDRLSPSLLCSALLCSLSYPQAGTALLNSEIRIFFSSTIEISTIQFGLNSFDGSGPLWDDPSTVTVDNTQGIISSLGGPDGGGVVLGTSAKVSGEEEE